MQGFSRQCWSSSVVTTWLPDRPGEFNPHTNLRTNQVVESDREVDDMNLERAIEIAVSAHKGQIDKAGAPYVLHPLRIMMSLATEEERIAGVLHDVVEDSDWTFERLQSEGFSEAILEALRSVTVVEGEAYEDFILRACENPVGRRVKIADVTDNMDLRRISEPTDRDMQRMKKYRKALTVLQR